MKADVRTEFDHEHSVPSSLIRWEDYNGGEVIVIVGHFFLREECIGWFH